VGWNFGGPNNLNSSAALPARLARSALEFARSAGAPKAAAAILSVALAGDLARELADLWRDRLPPVTAKSAETRIEAPLFDIQSVVDAHLFGASPPTESPKSAAAGAGVVPRVLTGTLATADPKHGYAIIGETPSSTHLWSAGQELPGGALLVEVFPDSVMLRVGARDETLKLPRHLQSGVIVQVASRTSSEAASSVSEAPTVPKTGYDVPGHIGPDGTPMQRWFNGFQATQVIRNGQFEGFRVQPEMRIRRQYPIEPGDVVTALNGVPLRDPDTLMQMLGKTHGGQVSLTVIRAGVPQTLTLDSKAN